jgi:hypothetical protein
MSDDVAVRWSNYDEFRSRIEYETRNKLSAQLQTKIAVVKEAGLSTQLLAGLELANAIILNQIPEEDNNEKLDESSQLRLI